MAHALLWSPEKTVVFVFTGLCFFSSSPTQNRALRSDRTSVPLEWGGISLGSTVPILDC